MSNWRLRMKHILSYRIAPALNSLDTCVSCASPMPTDVKKIRTKFFHFFPSPLNSHIFFLLWYFFEKKIYVNGVLRFIWFQNEKCNFASIVEMWLEETRKKWKIKKSKKMNLKWAYLDGIWSKAYIFIIIFEPGNKYQMKVVAANKWNELCVYCIKGRKSIRVSKSSAKHRRRKFPRA